MLYRDWTKFIQVLNVTHKGLALWNCACHTPDLCCYDLRLFASTTAHIQNIVFRLKCQFIDVPHYYGVLDVSAISMVITACGYIHLGFDPVLDLKKMRTRDQCPSIHTLMMSCCWHFGRYRPSFLFAFAPATIRNTILIIIPEFQLIQFLTFLSP